MRIDEALSTLRNLADRLHASGCHWRSERITESADAIEAAMREKDEAHRAAMRTCMEWRRKEKVEIERLRELVANDAYAASFQSMKQYRNALLSALAGKEGK